MKKLFISVIILLFSLNIAIYALQLIFQLAFFKGYPTLLATITILILLIKTRWKQGTPLIIFGALVSYSVFSIINGGHSHTSSYIIELLLLVVITILSSSVGDTFHHYFQSEGEAFFNADHKVIYHYQQIRTIIESEFARGFRYGYPIVLVRVQGINSKSIEKTSKSPSQQVDKLVGDFLTKNLRMTDILVRMDGLNNFLLICPGIETEEAKLMIDRLTQLSRTRELIGFNHVIACFPKDGRSFDELFERIHQQSTSFH